MEDGFAAVNTQNYRGLFKHSAFSTTPLEASWFSEQCLDDGRIEHLLNISSGWVCKMQRCAVQGHDPKWGWLLHLCAFSSSYLSEKQLCLPLLISFCFATSAEGERLSLFSLWAWGHKSKFLPPLALDPKADCQWWQPSMGNTPWCAWFNGACEVCKAWSAPSAFTPHSDLHCFWLWSLRDTFHSLQSALQ